MNPEVSQSKSRIKVVDALRGSALLGILLLHSIEHWDFYNNPTNSPAWLQTLDKITHDTAFFLYGGKAYAIFALMFGLSFFIILNSWSAKGIHFRGKFFWRLTILAIFGYLHGIIYCGDILLTIALLGIPLVFLYKLSNRVLTFFSILLLLQIPSLWHVSQILFSNSYQPALPFHWGLFSALQEVFTNGSFADVAAINTWTGQLMRLTWVYETGRYLQMAGLFFIGLLIGRNRLFEDSHAAIRVSKMAVLFGILGFAVIFPIKLQLSKWGLKDLELYYVENLVASYCNLTQTAIWAGGFYLIYQNLKVQKILNLLVPYGRMSLTCYATQALIGIPLFYGYGFALYQYLGAFFSIMIGALIFTIQCTCAHFWLKYFIYGPLEWVWRSLTYFTFDIPFLKQPFNNKELTVDIITAVPEKQWLNKE